MCIRDRKSPDPERLSIGPTMYQLDGSLLGWGAALFQVYKDSIWTSGLLAMPPDEINRLVRASAVGDAGLVVDATGDLAVHLLFDALEKEPSMRVRADGLDVMT